MESGTIVAVSALAFLEIDSAQVLAVGTGETIRIFDSSHKCLCSQRVLNGSVVHGLVQHNDALVVFGDKKVKLCRFKYHNNDVLNSLSLELMHDFGMVIDLVWDVVWLDESTLAFGTAQGYVQVWERVDEQQWDLKYQVLSKARRILYSFAFAPCQSNSKSYLIAAGGTVFGDVILWNAGEGSQGDVEQRLEGHQGPIFNVCWSEDALTLCTVGDDRTVRVWDRPNTKDLRFSQRWSSFGHNARVWHCAFLQRFVVSVGEDKLLRVWDANSGEVLAILESHFGRNVWKCAVSRDGGVVATGGGDAAVKFWDVFREVESRARLKTTLSHRTEMIAHAETSATKRRKIMDSLQYVSHVKSMPYSVLSSSSMPSLLLLCANFRFFLLENCDSLDVSTCRWTPLDPMSYINKLEESPTQEQSNGVDAEASSTKQVAKTSSLSVTEFKGQTFAVVGTDDGRVLFFGVNSTQDPPSVDLVCSERIHKQMQVTFVCAQPVSIEGQSLLVVLVSAADAAVFAFWLDTEDDSEKGVPQLRALRRVKVVPEKVMSRRTTAACLFMDRYVITGDHRGNVHFCAPLASDEFPVQAQRESNVQTVVCDTLVSLHGDCVVGVLAEHNGRLFSGGHNGMVMELHPIFQHDGETASLTEFQVVQVYRLGTIMNVIQFIRWTDDDRMIVAGNNYNDFVVWDTTEQYLIMRESRGGWKRPSELILDVKDPVRCCLLVMSLTATENKALGQGFLGVRRLGRALQHLERSTTASTTWPVKTLGENFHGRSIWTTRWLPAPLDNFLLTGCEDGCLKLTRVEKKKNEKQREPHKALADLNMTDAWHIYEKTERELPMECFNLHVEFSAIRPGSIRSSCFSVYPGEEKKDRKHFVLVTGGSGDTVRCWLVQFPEATSRGTTLEGTPELVFLCEHRSAREDDDDDTQRVLGLFSYCVDESVGAFGLHRVVASNSMGQLVVFELKSGKTSVPYESKQDPRFVSGGSLRRVFALDHGALSYPIRSLDCHITEEAALAFIGRTNGQLEVWTLNEESGEMVFAMQLHQNGVNALSVAAVPNTPSLLAVATGGDDQSIGMLIFSLASMTLERVPILVVDGLGSAVRGIVTDGELVWATGLDQRLRVWSFMQLSNARTSEGDANVLERVSMCGSNGEVNAKSARVKLLFEGLIDVSEIHCLDVTARRVAIAGLGVKVLEV